MKNKKKISGILLIIVIVSALLYSLIEIYLQAHVGKFPRATTIGIFIISISTFFVYIISKKRV